MRERKRVLQSEETVVLDQEREFWEHERGWLKWSRKRVLRTWDGLFEGMKRESFESVRRVVERDQEREFWECEMGCLKGSREKVFRAWERLFEWIGTRSFWERRGSLWRDRCREFLKAKRACLKGSMQSVFESGERLFERIGVRRFESRETAVWKDWQGVVESGERQLFEGIDMEFSEWKEVAFKFTDETIWTTAHPSTHPWKRIG